MNYRLNCTKFELPLSGFADLEKNPIPTGLTKNNNATFMERGYGNLILAFIYQTAIKIALTFYLKSK